MKAALPFFCLGKKHCLHEVWITLILFWLSACGTDDKISENAPLSETDEGEQVTKSGPNTGTRAKEEKDSNSREDVDASASIEGETTSHYISDSLKNTKVKITRLAKGVPVGGEIEFLDDGTLFSAFKNRTSVNND